MRTTTTVLTLEIDGEVAELYVEYQYHRGSLGARDSLGGVRGAGPPLEPDEPEWCEILSVKKEKDGDDIFETLDQNQIALLEEKCLGEVADNSGDYEE